MPYIVTEPFFCEELEREVRVGESLNLADAEARKYRGRVRRTTQAKVRTSRS